MNYIGDFAEDATVRIVLTTNNGDGAAVAPSSAFEAADFRVYKNGSATQKATTNGITVTSPFDSVTGLHILEIDTSNDTGDSGFWTTGADFWVVATPDETIDSQTVVGVIATFSIQNRYSSARLAAIETDTQDIQGRLPAALVSGRIDASVGAMAANTLTASALATDAVAEIQSGLATSAEIADVPTVSEFNARTIAAADYATSTALAAVAQYLDTEIQDILTDTGITLPAQITSAFTEIKGATWSSSTDTLEDIADAAGGGSTSIMVTPVVAQTPVRVVGSNISTFIGDLSTIRIGVFSGSDPVDLTAFGDLEVCVQQKNGTDLDFIEMADLTIDGDDDNYISWDPSGPSVSDVTRGKWSLRKASNKQVIAYGAWIVEDAALEDVGS
jgi:hypothetical protein